MTTDDAYETRRAAALALDPSKTPTVDLWPFTGEVLGISKNCTYRAAARGEIPTIRLGKRLVVPTAGLRRMLQLDPSDTTTLPTA